MPAPDYTEEQSIEDRMVELSDTTYLSWKVFEFSNREPGTAHEPNDPIPGPGQSSLSFVYGENSDLRIELVQQHELEGKVPGYAEPFQDSSAYDSTTDYCQYIFYEGISPIDTVEAIMVDGGRAVFPDVENVSQNNNFSADYLLHRYQTTFAQIVTRPPGDADDLERYCDTAGIEMTDLIGFDEYYR